MDGKQSAGAGRDAFLYVRRIEIERTWIDIGEDRPRAEPRDGTGGGEKRIGRGDNFVPGLQVDGHQRHEQGVGSRRDPDSLGAAAVSRHFIFERRDFGAEDEVLRIRHAIDGGADLFAQRGVLRFQIQQRYRDVGRGCRHESSFSQMDGFQFPPQDGEGSGGVDKTNGYCFNPLRTSPISLGEENQLIMIIPSCHFDRREKSQRLF